MADKSGKQYYEEMNHLDVDRKKLWGTIQKTFKSRLKTWLEICSHCGLCAESCFYYLANNKDPKQVPSYKIQATLGQIIKRKGDVDNANFCKCAWIRPMPNAPAARVAVYTARLGSIPGSCSVILRGLLFGQGFVPWEMKIGSGMHRIYRAQMDITTEDWVDTCEWMAEEYEDDWPGLTIPVDK